MSELIAQSHDLLISYLTASSVAEHRAEGGSRELEAGASGETGPSGQSPVSPQICIRISC